MQSLEVQLKVPDVWQQVAANSLQNGKDVIVAAPTGAGKTFIFELLVENGFSGKCIYTVPTRALANDKRMEWAEKGWEVGIATGDRAENLDAQVIVATLETQKWRLLRGHGPTLLVIDEYQMLGDEQRGLNYELSIACAPPDTQLLLMSGSVGNPQSVCDWLRKLGRKVQVIQHSDRPVPLEEVHIDALANRIPSSVQGFWPRAIAKALKSEMAPLLAFAPRRKAAEVLAIQVARMLPEEDPLILTKEQKILAGESLSRLLKSRVAYHHSGLSYAQRAALIEPLAKAGQLKVVVATMGLASGINFSMRSVLVTDKEYRSGDLTHLVRPDELLQMFGRAGRRGLDKIGYILVNPGKPRLSEARPIQLQRSNQLDWPSLVKVMQEAILDSEDPLNAARQLTQRLFSIQRVPIGLSQFQETGPAEVKFESRRFRQAVLEIKNAEGNWERKRASQRIPLKDTYIYHDDHYEPALYYSGTLSGIDEGTLCRLEKDENGRNIYGREMPVARIGNEGEGELVLTRWTLKHLRQTFKGNKKKPLRRKGWTLNRIEKLLPKHIQKWTSGGEIDSWDERGNVLYVRLNYKNAETFAHIDSNGKGLINPPERKIYHEADLDLPDTMKKAGEHAVRTAADAWYQLGLIDVHASPTRRGILFSFFNYGEGLAIAAALEDSSYPIEELVFDLANIRAGHRFSELEVSSGRLGTVCRATYREATFKGYLNKGVPTTYGDGAAELINGTVQFQKIKHLNEDLKSGDFERVKLEWKSILRHISHAPDLNWDRWLELKSEAAMWLNRLPREKTIEELPQLTSSQKMRHKSFLMFD